MSLWLGTPIQPEQANAEFGGAAVPSLLSAYMPTEHTCFCLLRAATGDAVRATNDKGDFARDRVTDVVLLFPVMPRHQGRTRIQAGATGLGAAEMTGLVAVATGRTAEAASPSSAARSSGGGCAMGSGSHTQSETCGRMFHLPAFAVESPGSGLPAIRVVFDLDPGGTTVI